MRQGSSSDLGLLLLVTQLIVQATTLVLFFSGSLLLGGSIGLFLALLLLFSVLAAGTSIFTYRYIRRLEERSLAQERSMRSTSKFAALGEVSAGMAHEINTPLGAITLSASQLKDLLPELQKNPEMVTEIIEDILAASEKISRIVRGLRNFSRGSSLEADFVFCDLPTVVSESMALCEASLRNAGVELRMGELPKALDLQCNPSQISQVLINLVNNARDAAKEAEERWVQLSVRGVDGQVEIRVSDSGKGLSPEAKEKLFQPFFTTKEVGQGTGIGLSMVYGIVTTHKGQVYLDTSAKHTTFVVKLPRFQAA